MCRLVDLWTNTLDPAEYVSWLDSTLAKMRMAGLGAVPLTDLGKFTAATAPRPGGRRPRARSRDAMG